MNTQTNKEVYIEPMGFTGTNGEWIGVQFKDEFVIKEKELYERGFSDRIAEMISYKADGQLMAQSKEMAKVLQEIIENASQSNIPDEYYLNKLSLENAKQVLKNAGL